jgi:hypothetical protein
MSKNYKIVEQGVYEKKTDQIVLYCKDQKISRKIVNQLSGGMGFNGWTPSFFLKPVKYVKL